MIINEHLPGNYLLSKYISCYYFVYTQDIGTEISLLPNTHILLSIEFRAVGDTKTTVTIHNSLRPSRIILQKNSKLLFISFLPLALCHFSNTSLQLKEKMESEFAFNFTLLDQTFDEIQILSIIEEHLMQRYMKKDINHLKIAIAQMDSVTNIKTITQSTHKNYRTLLRHFVKYTGKTLSEYVRVIRFRKALEHKNIDTFYDESHYIREFKHFTGYSPSNFKYELKPIKSFLLFKRLKNGNPIQLF